METFLSQNIALLCPTADVHMLWLGDFNHHHPMWEDIHNHHLFNYPFSQPLIDLIADYVMLQLLPSGIPTLQSNSTGNWTRPDNVLGTEGTLNAVITCDTEPVKQGPKMDHLPIILTLELAVIQKDDIPHSNWREVDWKRSLAPRSHPHLHSHSPQRRNFSKWPKLSQGPSCPPPKPVYLWQNPAHTPNDGGHMRGLPDHPCQWEHKTLVTNWGGVTSDSEKTQAVYWEFLQRPEEDKVKVQGTRSKYDQGFSLKDKSKRYPRE
ncbi:hypothetical protein BDR07DRAFT_1612748 [Suillus spraguei]|nr:hypothetical protein BDR07DRAFT_1612748 [Suillus spraguei]